MTQQYVCGFMFSENRKTVALIKKLHGPEEVIGRLNGIGGKVEKDELEPDAMAREFFEETGVVTNHESWRHFATLEGSDSTHKYTVFFYKMMSDLVANVKTMEDEEVVLVPVDHVLKGWHKIVDNLSYLIPSALHARNPYLVIHQ